VFFDPENGPPKRFRARYDDIIVFNQPLAEVWSSQVLVDTSTVPFRSCFKFLGADSTKVTVAAHLIQRRFDVVRAIRTCDLSILVNSLPDTFLLQTTEEGFGDSIVPTVARSTHARFQVIGSAKAAPVIAPVLRALIGMNDSLSWVS
jgi:hypothetical protein